MMLYAVQHAEAMGEEENPERPLTDKGRKDAAKVAKFIAEHANVRVAQIVHSGKIRARQTAEILAQHLRSTERVRQLEGLAPMDDLKIVDRILHEASEDVMVVGHLPHLSKLAAYLICGDESRRVVDFKNGGVVALSRDDAGTWSAEWIVTPEIVPG